MYLGALQPFSVIIPPTRTKFGDDIDWTRSIWKMLGPFATASAAARRITIHQVSRRTPPARRCPQQQQRQRVTEGTAMTP